MLKVSPGVPVPDCLISGTSALVFSATACLVSWLPGYLCAPASLVKICLVSCYVFVVFVVFVVVAVVAVVVVVSFFCLAVVFIVVVTAILNIHDCCCCCCCCCCC